LTVPPPDASDSTSTPSSPTPVMVVSCIWMSRPTVPPVDVMSAWDAVAVTVRDGGIENRDPSAGTVLIEHDAVHAVPAPSIVMASITTLLML
jgi:hypothetical protein